MKDTWQEEFKDPSSEYRALPFWSWNGDLDKSELRRQIDCFEQMGYGGFVIHSRIGLSEEYMGPVFIDCVKYCIDYARKKNMRVFLYDDDRWPSGYGAGEVTKSDPNLKARALLVTGKRYEDGYHLSGRTQMSRMTENGVLRLLSTYCVSLDGKGFLHDYHRASTDDGKANLFAYEVTTDELAWFNNSSYPDLLNPDATSKFLEVSYERYRKELGNMFGTSAEAIFTDEPQHTMFHTLRNSRQIEDLIIPCTIDMESRFKSDMGYSILDRLPEVIWNTEDPVSEVRYHFYRWMTKVFTDSYSRVLGDWCQRNNILLTGHLLKEESLASLSQCTGDVMCHYGHFDIPGIDILVDRREFQTAKQVQSIRNQFGKKGVICELFGVTNWDFPFSGHLRQANWLMALGTSIRVPHLAWMFMGGEAKRDYPAPLDFHSPWAGRYKVVENCLSRANLFTSQGKPCTKVAVLNPVEGYWAISGPDDQTIQMRERMNRNLHTLVDWLLFSQIDFDFVSEATIPELLEMDTDGKVRLGKMKYNALVIPETYTIRRTTLNLIGRFADHNGPVFMLGEKPSHVDGKRENVAFGDGVLGIGFDHDAIIDALEPYCDVRISTHEGKKADNIIYSLKKEDRNQFLFLTACIPSENTTAFSAFRKPLDDPIINVSVRGIHSVSICDGETGVIRRIHSTIHEGWTNFSYPFYDNGSLMAFLGERTEDEPLAEVVPILSEPVNICTVDSYSLDEDNVLVLDMPECFLDETSCGKEHILRADERFREMAGYRKRTSSYVQPWVEGDKNPTEHTVRLEYSIESEVEGIPVDLAFEGDTSITFNGSALKNTCNRTYIDSMIRRTTLGRLKKGTNTLSLEIPFGPRTDLEACFLLGEFGVRLDGNEAIICRLPSRLGWRPLKMQNMPFYGGNIDYCTEVILESAGHYCVTIPKSNAPMVDVYVDDQQPIPVIREPFRADLGQLKKGRHTIRFRCYGTRINQFGQIHNVQSTGVYWGPGSWRTTGTKWSYSYQLRDTGMLAEPVLFRLTSENR